MPATGVEIQNPNTICKMVFRSTGFSGSYRIKIIVKDQKKYGLDASNNLIEVGNEDYILYDETTGNNIFYFNVNEVTP